MTSEFDYRESHLASGVGEKYADSFKNNKRRAVFWSLERRILCRIMKRFFRNKTIRYLDFACGTGRILSFLEDRVDSAVGIDVSCEMLSKCRAQTKKVQIYEADITVEDPLHGKTFDLITAFRFFPNAQKELRQQVLSSLCVHLDDDGCLVFNNHRNASSSFNRLYKYIKRRELNGRTSFCEINEMLEKVGLHIVASYHVGVLPTTEKKCWFPSFLLHFAETILSKIKCLEHFAEDVIYVCKKHN